jgi:hypothetical protein
VRIEVRPEAGPEAEDVVLRALADVALRERRGAAVYRSEWRRASLAEGVEHDPGQPSPRSSRGATRA